MKRTLFIAILALSSIVTFNAQASTAQCDAIANDYVANANNFRSQHKNFMQHLAESDNSITISQGIMSASNKLTGNLKALTANNCSLVEFVEAIYLSRSSTKSQATKSDYIINGQIAPEYCYEIRYHNNAMHQYIDVFSGERDTEKDFLLGIYQKANTDDIEHTWQSLFYQFELLDFLALYTQGEKPVTPEKIANLTPAQMVFGQVKALYAVEIYQAVADFQEVRNKTFCSAK
jgi:hypothetical protein